MVDALEIWNLSRNDASEDSRPVRYRISYIYITSTNHLDIRVDAQMYYGVSPIPLCLNTKLVGYSNSADSGTSLNHQSILANSVWLNL